MSLETETKAAITIALHYSDCYPVERGEAVEAFVAQCFARVLDLLFREYFNDEGGPETALHATSE